MSAAAYSMRSGRENKGPPSTDLLVCFPPRTHLALMPKPIYSPARTEPGTRRHSRHARKPSNRGLFAGGIGHASPLLRARTNSRRHINNSDNISEPTSPKVTCAGQIKIKHKPASCSNWQSVMEEIERIHNSRKQKKRHSWAGALGFKKDVMQFLTCLRNIRFDFRCFGSFPTSVVDDDDDDDDEEEYEDESEDESYRETISSRRSSQLKEATNDNSHDHETEDHQSSNKTVFSKWFMVLQEDHLGKEYAMNKSSDITHVVDEDDEEEEDRGPCVPPPNALLLMRCRSAPLNKWLQEEKEEEREREKEKERLLVMTCGEDHFSKLSTDVAKETWIVGAGMLSRSRSCRR